MDEIQARMKEGLVSRFADFFPEGPIDSDWRAFLEGIEGREVTLVFTAGDAFEKSDNNYWLPDCMWTAIAKEPA